MLIGISISILIYRDSRRGEQVCLTFSGLTVLEKLGFIGAGFNTPITVLNYYSNDLEISQGKLKNHF
jgi:hypothetical protein